MSASSCFLERFMLAAALRCSSFAACKFSVSSFFLSGILPAPHQCALQYVLQEYDFLHFFRQVSQGSPAAGVAAFMRCFFLFSSAFAFLAFFSFVVFSLILA